MASTITLPQLNRELQTLANNLTGAEHGNIMVQLASEALTLNRMRVQEEGENDKGQKFKPYSTKPMLTGRTGMTTSAYGSIAGSKDKRRDLEWRTVKGHKLFILDGGYKQFRELHGRQTEFVDFTFTGRLWNNIKLVSGRAELNSGVAVITTTEEQQQKKLQGNTAKRGDILALSREEERRMAELYEAWVEQECKKAGLT